MTVLLASRVINIWHRVNHIIFKETATPFVVQIHALQTIGTHHACVVTGILKIKKQGTERVIGLDSLCQKRKYNRETEIPQLRL